MTITRSEQFDRFEMHLSRARSCLRAAGETALALSWESTHDDLEQIVVELQRYTTASLRQRQPRQADAARLAASRTRGT